jgi:hypothetical protein
MAAEILCPLAGIRVLDRLRVLAGAAQRNRHSVFAHA